MVGATSGTGVGSAGGTVAKAGVEPSSSEVPKDEANGGQLGLAAASGETDNGAWAAANRARHRQSIDNLRKVRCMDKLGVLTLYMITQPKEKLHPFHWMQLMVPFSIF